MAGVFALNPKADFMRVGYLGAGTWGFCLANHLAENGHEVVLWTISEELANRLNAYGDHPNLMGVRKANGVHVTHKIREALAGAEMVVEGVTSAGIRPVFGQVKEIGVPDCPIVLTSKGIEQHTGLLLGEVLVQVWGKSIATRLAA